MVQNTFDSVQDYVSTFDFLISLSISWFKLPKLSASNWYTCVGETSPSQSGIIIQSRINKYTSIRTPQIKGGEEP